MTNDFWTPMTGRCELRPEKYEELGKNEGTIEDIEVMKANEATN
jgi:hypothetical protein